MGSRSALLALACLLLSACAAGFEQFAADPGSGFAIYRSGRLDRGELGALCAAGVEEILVLDGSAAQRECRLREAVCPRLRVRYNRRQAATEPLSTGFLAAFDAWVEEARRDGRKVAFRCRHGWHRAGRLTAYYRMRFEEVPAEEAIGEMYRRGRFMDRHPQLEPQVRALADLLAGRPCSVAEADCPVADDRGDEPLAAGGGFLDDACP